jgi:hypothetical protein
VTLWQELQQEVQAGRGPNAPAGDFDGPRRARLAKLRDLTGRPVILYAADFLNKRKLQAVGSDVIIDLEDIEGFREIIDATPGSEVDILIHSPGGSAEATESIVELLRSRFQHIRFLIPGAAKSAATMLAMAGDVLLLDEGSELGPTDPQLTINNRQSPAGAIRDQFGKAVKDLQTNPALMPAWLPILQQYGPSLLVECENHIALSVQLVSKWLRSYMFRGERNAADKARKVAKRLSNDRLFRSHARRIGKDQLEKLGLKVLDTRSDPALHRAIEELYVSVLVTFEGTGAYKIFENSEGEALIKVVSVQPIQIATPPQPPPTQRGAQT